MKFLRSLLIISSIVFYVYGDNVEISLRNAEPNCVCNNTIGCIRKCCNPDNIIPGDALNCTHVGVDNFRINISTEFGDEIPKMCYKYGVMKCEKSFYRLDPLAYEEDQFEIRFDGKLWTTNLQDLYDSDGYCLENFEDIGMSAYVCTLPELVQSGSVYAVGMIVSLPFLFVTFFVHLLLPVKSIHTKCLMGFVLSLFFAYATLITLEYYKDFDRIICFIIGMICVFSFMSSFLWTNAMSIDIWLTFSGRTRGYGRSRKKAEMKRFWFYFTYAYGLGLVQVIIIVMLTIFGDDDGWYNPLFAKSKCWFQENMGLLLYFYGPLMTIIIVNVVFFGLTAWRIRQTQKDTAVLRQGENKSNSDDEQRFKVFLKLLLAMGGNWSLEVISFLWEWQVGDVPVILSYFVDFCNVLYGVVIFFLFTFKKSHWTQLQKHYTFVRNIKVPQICQRKKVQATEEIPAS